MEKFTYNARLSMSASKYVSTLSLIKDPTETPNRIERSVNLMYFFFKFTEIP